MNTDSHGPSFEWKLPWFRPRYQRLSASRRRPSTSHFPIDPCSSVSIRGQFVSWIAMFQLAQTANRLDDVAHLKQANSRDSGGARSEAGPRVRESDSSQRQYRKATWLRRFGVVAGPPRSTRNSQCVDTDPLHVGMRFLENRSQHRKACSL